MKDESIDQINIRRNAMTITTKDEILFNQIKGNHLNAFMQEKELHHVQVKGNAQAVYYGLDEEDKYLGVNDIECSEMILYFEKQDVSDIHFYKQPTAQMIPIKKANHEDLKLEGFRWETQRKPAGVSDLLMSKEAFEQR
jgi:hypothetical protein